MMGPQKVAPGSRVGVISISVQLLHEWLHLPADFRVLGVRYGGDPYDQYDPYDFQVFVSGPRVPKVGEDGEPSPLNLVFRRQEPVVLARIEGLDPGVDEQGRPLPRMLGYAAEEG